MWRLLCVIVLGCGGGAGGGSDGGSDGSSSGDGGAEACPGWANGQPAGSTANALDVTSSGSLLVVGTTDLEFAGDRVMTHLGSDGVRDPAFGMAGVRTDPLASGADEWLTVTPRSGGGWIVAGKGADVMTPTSSWDGIVEAFTPTGQPDPGFCNGRLLFGSEGTEIVVAVREIAGDFVVVMHEGASATVRRYGAGCTLETDYAGTGVATIPLAYSAAAIGEDGGVFVAGIDVVTNSVRVHRLGPDGTHLASFGTAGVVELEGDKQWGTRLTIDHSFGGGVLVGINQVFGKVFRVSATGILDTAATSAMRRVMNDAFIVVYSVHALADGGLIASGTSYENGDGRVVRFDAEGNVVTSFGTGGIYEDGPGSFTTATFATPRLFLGGSSGGEAMLRCMQL